MEIYLSLPISSYNQLSAVDSSIRSRVIGFCVSLSLSTLINFSVCIHSCQLIYKCIDADCFLCICWQAFVSCFYTYIQCALISIQLLPSTYLVQCIYLTYVQSTRVGLSSGFSKSRLCMPIQKCIVSIYKSIFVFLCLYIGLKCGLNPTELQRNKSKLFLKLIPWCTRHFPPSRTYLISISSIRQNIASTYSPVLRVRIQSSLIKSRVE